MTEAEKATILAALEALQAEAAVYRAYATAMIPADAGAAAAVAAKHTATDTALDAARAILAPTP